MASVIFETVTGTASFAPIKSIHYGFKGDITALNTNGGDILMREAGTVGAGIPVPAGATKHCKNPTDLSKLEFKGNGFLLLLDGIFDQGW